MSIGLLLLGGVFLFTKKEEIKKIDTPTIVPIAATTTKPLKEKKVPVVIESVKLVTSEPKEQVVKEVVIEQVASSSVVQPTTQQPIIITQYVPVYIPEQTQTINQPIQTTIMNEETPAPKVAAVPYQDPVIVFKVNGQVVNNIFFQASPTDMTVFSWEASGQEPLDCTLNDNPVDQFGSKDGIVTEQVTYTLKCRGKYTNSRIEKTITLLTN